MHLFCFLCCVVLFSNAQQASLVNSTGANISDDTYQISYSVGEVATGEFGDSDHSLEEGYLSDYFPTIAEEPLGVGEAPTLSQITLLPNPASEMVRINGAELVVSFVRIFDQSGRLLIRRKIDETTFPVSDMKDGIYTILIYSEAAGEQLVGYSQLIIQN